jgi:hypothetical protein
MIDRPTLYILTFEGFFPKKTEQSVIVKQLGRENNFQEMFSSMTTSVNSAPALLQGFWSDRISSV